MLRICIHSYPYSSKVIGLACLIYRNECFPALFCLTIMWKQKDKMRIIYLSGILCLIIAFSALGEVKDKNTSNSETKLSVLAEFIDPVALELALMGYTQIQDSIATKGNFLAIIDFSKSSIEKRFYLINMKDTSLVHIDYVSHGKHSGELYANVFSNEEHSLKTSLGFYKIAETYSGCHGLSIRLDGLDTGFNDNARSRAIVMHQAFYAEPTVINEIGRLGKSFGCPAFPSEGFSLIVNHIKVNDILFNYYPDETYLKSSVWLH